MQKRLQKFSLLLGDIIVLYAALYATLFIRYWKIPETTTWNAHFGPFSIAFIAWIIIFYIADLYNIHLAVNNSKFFYKTLRSVIIAGLLTIAFFYIDPQISIAPKTNMIIYVLVFSFLFLNWRRLYNVLLFSYVPKNKLLIVGYNEKVRELATVLEQKPHLGYKIALILDQQAKNQISSIPVTYDFSKLQSIILNQKISNIILAADPHDSEELRKYLFSLLPLKINFETLTDFYETITGKIPIDTISEMWFLEKLSEGRKIMFDNLKRAFDFFFALVIFLMTIPFWPFIILIIKLESQGPAFIKMLRSGKNNQAFKMYKFRTMREDGNTRGHTLQNDPRITVFGSFMRKTRLDEIPQVINVIRGDMSFVGPRPERPEFVRELEQQVPFYNERHLVKPGLTGWAQVAGGYLSPTKEDTLKKIQYDLFYIKNRSLYLDASIILKTIAIVLSKGGV